MSNLLYQATAQLLLSDPAITAFTGPRVFPGGLLEQPKVDFPAIAMYAPAEGFSLIPVLQRFALQIDIFAQDRVTGGILRQAVRNNLNETDWNRIFQSKGLSILRAWEASYNDREYEPETKIFHSAAIYTVFARTLRAPNAKSWR